MLNKEVVSATEQRRLLAVLVADIVAYARLMEENEDDTFFRLKEINSTIISPSAVRNHGQIVKWTGNGFISVFQSAVDAVRAAIEIQSAVAAVGANSEPDRQIRLRVGISAGDVIIVPGNVFGDTVNAASRLQSLAAPGSVCISRAIRDAVRGKFTIEYEDRTEADLKTGTEGAGAFRVVFDPIAWTMNQPKAAPKKASRRWPAYTLGGAAAVALIAAAAVSFKPNPHRVEAAAASPPAASSPATNAVPSAAVSAEDLDFAPARTVGTPTENSANTSSALSAAPTTPSSSEATQAAPATSPPVASSGGLNVALGSALPALDAGESAEVVRAYQAAATHKAQAVSLQPPGLWRSANRPTADDAATSALEDCQVYYGSPCALLAIDDKTLPVPPDGKWSVHDMPRVRYTGDFDPAQIPGTESETRTRSDILGYKPKLGPKAVAFQPTGGKVFVVTRAENQRAAEETALRYCDDDPLRGLKDGPCLLYAVGNQTVLTRRSTVPLSPPVNK
ncbi:MAG TPA: adenylate/guanylate cyclase domain-containing protein [Stellaceae bacterium]|nr:adenylate/guanylate cyclase domain-containing protein [Stellaceae bacterium]